MKIKEMIEKLKNYDPETEIVMYDDVGKGVRKSSSMKRPRYFIKERIVFALSNYPIEKDVGSRYDDKYKRKECLLID